MAWVDGNLSAANYAMKKGCLDRWLAHRISTGLPGGGKLVGRLATSKVGAIHLNDFIAARRKMKATAGRGTGKGKAAKPIGPTAVAADMVHIKASFNWGSENGRLPIDFRPFARVAKIKIPKRPKHESELPTAEEYESLLKWAGFDLAKIRGEDGRYRNRKPAEGRTGSDNPYLGFADLLKLYHGLGPRTGELAQILVKHVNMRKSEVILGEHKRSKPCAIRVRAF